MTRLPETIEEVLALLGPIEGVRVNNHWVPASYLERFTSNAEEDGAIQLYDRTSPIEPRQTGIRVAAVEKHLYVTESPTIPVPDVIERLLAQFIEQPFPSIRDRLVVAASVAPKAELTGDDRLSLSIWIAVQHQRTPRQRDLSLWLDELHTTVTALGRLTGSGTQHDRRARRRMQTDIRKGRVLFRAPRDRWIGTFLKQAFDVAGEFGKLQFLPVALPVGESVPASDSPVVISGRRSGETTYRFDAGVNDPDVEVLLPLSPTVVLVLRQRGMDDPTIGGADWTSSVQERIAMSADRFLYASEPSQRWSMLLSRPPRPETVVEIGSDQFRVGTPVGVVADRITRSPGKLLRVGPRR